ncbi:MAG TPA: PilZ domain-containing protein [Pseudolabrys sp.]|nr:PilZ domain-containing protein [Pseudolabrys sp.]
MGELISLSERRAFLRRGISLPAQIERDGQAPLRCQLIDVSRHGACLSAPDIALPNVFVLKVPDASRHACEVLWRDGRMLGVRFAEVDQLLARTAKATAILKRSCARARQLNP